MQFCPYGEICNLLNTNLVCMDEGDSARFANCYAEGGSCEILLLEKCFTGRDELKALADSLHERFKGVKHWEGNVSLSKVGEMFTNVSYWKALDGGEVVSTGIHRDLLILENDEWKIKTRKIVHTYTKQKGHLKLEGE
jgi:hypothetical protein